MTTNVLPYVEVIHNPCNHPIDAAVIWLHGLGANGHDFEPIVPELGLPDNLAIRFIFPHAPARSVTINGGMVMPAWYDIYELSINRNIDVPQIEASSQQIANLIQQQLDTGMTSERIIIAGFSQGGAVAYHTALSYPKKLAGLLALSTYLATQEQITYHPANLHLPISIMHGTQDPVVPEVLGQMATKALTEKGYQAQYHTYPMAHQVCMPQIVQIGQWFNQLLIG